MSRRKVPARYKVGQPYVHLGEEGWTIMEIMPSGMLIEFKKPWKQIYLPVDLIK